MFFPNSVRIWKHCFGSKSIKDAIWESNPQGSETIGSDVGWIILWVGGRIFGWEHNGLAI
jgi:hypothetical protein